MKNREFQSLDNQARTGPDRARENKVSEAKEGVWWGLALLGGAVVLEFLAWLFPDYENILSFKMWAVPLWIIGVPTLLWNTVVLAKTAK